MQEISLYRKYRPHNFDNLIGQDHIKTTIINAFKTAHVAHAYLFTGPRGTGKTSTARLIARALNCSNLGEGFEPCNACDFCKEINDGRLIDLIEIDAASNRGIDEVRDLKEKINFSPSRSKYKVYIIDEVHMMTKEAFNALLKTLEEPPAHAYFILATTEAHKIPETIISRCQRFDFKRISQKALMTRLSYIAQLEGVTAEDRALEVICKYVDGGLRDAIGLLEQLTVDGKLEYTRVQEILGMCGLGLLEDMYKSLMVNQTREALNIINDLHSQGSDLRQFAHEFIELLRQKMLEAVNSSEHELLHKLIRMIDILQQALLRLESSIPQLSLEMAVIEITIKFQNPEKDGDGQVAKSIGQSAKSAVQPSKVAIDDRKHQPITDELNQKLDLNMETLLKNWPRIVERIKTPSLRISLKNAEPSQLDGINITLQFSTNFHKDKVMESAHRVELEEIIREIFGQSIKIFSIVKSLEIKAVVEDVAAVNDGKPAAMSGVNPVALNEALEIFGGQVVE